MLFAAPSTPTVNFRLYEKQSAAGLCLSLLHLSFCHYFLQGRLFVQACSPLSLRLTIYPAFTSHCLSDWAILLSLTLSVLHLGHPVVILEGGLHQSFLHLVQRSWRRFIMPRFHLKKRKGNLTVVSRGSVSACLFFLIFKLSSSLFLRSCASFGDVLPGSGVIMYHGMPVDGRVRIRGWRIVDLSI